MQRDVTESRQNFPWMYFQLAAVGSDGGRDLLKIEPGIVRCDAVSDDFGVNLISSLNPKMPGPLPPSLPLSLEAGRADAGGEVCQVNRRVQGSLADWVNFSTMKQRNKMQFPLLWKTPTTGHTFRWTISNPIFRTSGTKNFNWFFFQQELFLIQKEEKYMFKNVGLFSRTFWFIHKENFQINLLLLDLSYKCKKYETDQNDSEN